MLTIDNLKTEERRLIIDHLKSNEVLKTFCYDGSPTVYVITNDCKEIPLDKNGKLQEDRATDISNDKDFIKRVKQEYLDRPKRMKQLEKEMEMINQSWLSGELID